MMSAAPNVVSRIGTPNPIRKTPAPSVMRLNNSKR
jgi:hypothetical protein